MCIAFNENRIHAVGVIGNGTLDSCLIVYEPIYGNLKRVKFREEWEGNSDLGGFSVGRNELPG